MVGHPPRRGAVARRVLEADQRPVCYDSLMDMECIQVEFPESVARSVREAAEADGESLSSWLCSAAIIALATVGGEAARPKIARLLTDCFQAEHGEFTEEELAAADRLWRG